MNTIPPMNWPVPASPAAVGPARDRALAHALSWRYRLDEEGRQMFRLLVSEMVTNAVLYGMPPDDPDATVSIGLEPRPEGIVIVVRDHSHIPPAHLCPDSTDEHGRGMTIMQELAAASGWYPLPDGKSVYALFAAERVLTRDQRRLALMLDRVRAARPRIHLTAVDHMAAA